MSVSATTMVISGMSVSATTMSVCAVSTEPSAVWMKMIQMRGITGRSRMPMTIAIIEAPSKCCATKA
jgi:hypothetical protein